MKSPCVTKAKSLHGMLKKKATRLQIKGKRGVLKKNGSGIIRKGGISVH